MTWDRFRIAREVGADPNDPRLVEYDEVTAIAALGSRLGVGGTYLYLYYTELKRLRALHYPHIVYTGAFLPEKT